MKRRWYIIFVTLGIFVTPPQADADEPNYALRVGAQVGGAWSQRFRAEGEPGTLTAEYRTGPLFGATAELDLLKSSVIDLALQIEPSFIQKGTNIHLEGVELGGTRMDYFEIPLLLKATHQASSKIGVHALAGAYLDVLIDSAELDSMGNVIPDATEFEYDRLDLGLVAGVGIGFRLSRNVAVSLGVRYEQGLTNIDDDAGYSPGRRHRSFLLLLGVDYELWRSSPTAE